MTVKTALGFKYQWSKAPRIGWHSRNTGELAHRHANAVARPPLGTPRGGGYQLFRMWCPPDPGYCGHKMANSAAAQRGGDCKAGGLAHLNRWRLWLHDCRSGAWEAGGGLQRNYCDRGRMTAKEHGTPRVV